MKYRPEIDGLRAFSVFAVMLFHTFPGMFPGGYVGVDVFFVISGYLITALIQKDLKDGTFSFIDFYGRRARRIFPSLLVVLVACFVAGWFLLFPDEFRRLGKYVASSALFIQNFILWKENGYFDILNIEKPLLHIWSLGVEEQFYLLLPVFLLWISRNRLNFTTIAACVVVVSFGLNIRFADDGGVSAFYFPWTRFWEFMVGGILACGGAANTLPMPEWLRKSENCLNRMIYEDEHPSDGRTFASILFLLGFVGLLACVTQFPRHVTYPGYWGALPVLATAVILFAGRDAPLAHWVLANRVMVWFGKISYPLYLWHWMIFSFLAIVIGGGVPRPWRVATILAAVILACATYYLVERPVRNARRKRLVEIVLYGLIGVVALVGALAYVQDGFSGRDVHKSGAYGYVNCGVFLPSGICEKGNRESPRKILMFGDSHLMHLTRAFEERFGDRYSIDIIFGASCFMGGKMSIPKDVEVEECERRTEIVRALDLTAYDYVVTAQRWHGYGLAQVGDFYRALKDRTEMLAAIAPEKVIIVGSTADVDFRCIKSNLRFSFNNRKCTEDKQTPVWNRNFITASKMFGKYNFVFPYKIICPDDRCHAVDDEGYLNYVDENHLSYTGSKPAVAQMARIIK